MNQTRNVFFFLAFLLCAVPSWPQGPLQVPNIFGDISDEQLKSIVESRQLANRELDEQSALFKTPDIAGAMETPWYLIAVAKIIAVHLPADSSSRTIVTFRVERFLRGQSEATEFDVESRWNPQSSKDAGQAVFVGGLNGVVTALDLAEPKAGNRYILGYTHKFSRGRFAFASGVVDLQDPAQTELISNVERFLAIESSADGIGLDAFLNALDDTVPWIRNIAVHRLSVSYECYASPSCVERFSAAVKQRLHSDRPNEREEAVDWLIWVDSLFQGVKARTGNSDGVPVLPDSTLRPLMESATQDRNVVIGDRAFERLVEFDAARSASPDKCYVIVPALRKSAHIDSQQHNPLPPDFPVPYSYFCVPPE